MPRSNRSCRKAWPNDFSTDLYSGILGVFFFIGALFCLNVDYKSTDYSMNFLIWNHRMVIAGRQSRTFRLFPVFPSLFLPAYPPSRFLIVFRILITSASAASFAPLVQCLESSTFDFGNLTCWRNASTVAKIRISKSEIRNNIKIQILSLRFLSFEFVSCFDIRISDFNAGAKRMKYNIISNCHFEMQNLWNNVLGADSWPAFSSLPR